MRHFFRNDLDSLLIEDKRPLTFYREYFGEPFSDDGWEDPNKFIFILDPYEDKFVVEPMKGSDHTSLWMKYLDERRTKGIELDYNLYDIPRGYWFPDEGVLAIYYYRSMGRSGPSPEDFGKVMREMTPGGLLEEEIDQLYSLGA